MISAAFAVFISLSAGAWAAPKAVFVLPADAGLSLEWALEPLDDAAEAKAAGKKLKLLADPKGRPWFASAETRRLLDPIGDKVIPVGGEFRDVLWLDGGELVACADGSLSTLVITKGKDGEAAGMAPLIPLPLKECRLFPGGAGSLYVAGLDAKSGKYDFTYLSRGKADKIISSKSPITAGAGDGTDAFIAGGKMVYKLGPGASKAEAYIDAGSPVRSLAYSKESGLFYATDKTVGFVGAQGRFDFLKAESPEIVLRGTDLLVRVGRGTAVARIKSADKFKTVRFPEPAKRK